MLKPEQRAKIESEFRATFPSYNPSSMRQGMDVFSIVELHAEAFVKWRYMYEIERGSFSISQMQDALEIILRLFRSRYMLKNLNNHPVI